MPGGTLPLIGNNAFLSVPLCLYNPSGYGHDRYIGHRGPIRLRALWLVISYLLVRKRRSQHRWKLAVRGSVLPIH